MFGFKKKEDKPVQMPVVKDVELSQTDRAIYNKVLSLIETGDCSILPQNNDIYVVGVDTTIHTYTNINFYNTVPATHVAKIYHKDVLIASFDGDYATQIRKRLFQSLRDQQDILKETHIESFLTGE